MNLLCPNCQKMLQVGDQYSGQVMQCPMCTGQFTVPVMPKTPGAATAAPMPAPPQVNFAPGMAAPPAPQPKANQAAVPLPAPPPPQVPIGYTKQKSYVLHPGLMPWVAPVCLVGIFVLTFFAWVGMYPGGVAVASQNPWQAVLGDASLNEDWTKYVKNDRLWEPYFGTDVTDLEKPGFGLFALLYILAIVPAGALAVVSVIPGLKGLPQRLPLSLQPLWRFRALLVSLLALAALVLLVLQVYVFGFPLENAAVKRVGTVVEGLKSSAGTSGQKDLTRWQLEEGIRLGAYNLQTTWKLQLVFLLNALAVIGALLEYWLERRGPQPLPRMDLQW